jgi:hypothetical protein
VPIADTLRVAGCCAFLWKDNFRTQKVVIRIQGYGPFSTPRVGDLIFGAIYPPALGAILQSNKIILAGASFVALFSMFEHSEE